MRERGQDSHQDKKSGIKIIPASHVLGCFLHLFTTIGSVRSCRGVIRIGLEDTAQHSLSSWLQGFLLCEDPVNEFGTVLGAQDLVNPWYVADVISYRER